jgi:hypothetical protein
VQFSNIGGIPTIQVLYCVSVKTANYNANIGEFVRFNNTSGNDTLFLPNNPIDSVLCGGKITTLGGSNTTTVACQGSDTFNISGGGKYYTLKLVNQGMICEYKKSEHVWVVLNDNIPLGDLDGRYILVGASAGGDLAGTYPNPTIKASVGLTGNPTSTTQATGDNSNDIATDAFVQTALAGINPAIAVQYATTVSTETSGLTYANGVSGVGATMTGANNATTTFDGHTFVVGDVATTRVLIKNDAQTPSGAFNGIYLFTALHTLTTGDIFTRALDYDQPSDMNNTGAIPVINGTANTTTSWVLTSNITTVGASPLTYTKFSYAPSSIVLSVSGTANQIGSTGGQNPVISIVSSPIFPGAPTIASPGNATQNILTTDAAQTETNKTFTSTTNTFGGVTAGFGSDAKGDIYQNGGSSNIITRLGIGSTGQGLTVVSGLAAWGRLTAAGLPTDVAYLDVQQQWTKGQAGTPYALTDASTIAVDLSQSNNFSITLGGNRNLQLPTNINAGQSGFITVKQDRTGSRTLFGSPVWIYTFAGGTAPTLTTTAVHKDILGYAVERYNTSSAVTCTTTGANAVFTWTAHGLVDGTKIQFSAGTTTTPALNTTYYVAYIDANTFNLSTSLANVAAGTYITSSGTSGSLTAAAGSIFIGVSCADCQ